MSSRWKKIWADFWGNRTRTILTVMTIAVGTFAIGFTSNLGQYMSESMENDFLSANPSEAEIYASPMTDDSVKIARQIPGVNAVEGRSTTSGKIIKPGTKDISINFTAMESPSALTLNLLKPAQNEANIPPLHNKEVLLDSSATSLGYKPGDTIQVEFDNGKHRQLRLAGYLHNATGFPYNLAESVTAFVTPDTLEWLGGSLDYNMLAVSVAEKTTDAEHVTQVAQAVADRLKRSGETVYFVNVYQPGHHFAYTIAQGMFFIMGTLGWMTVLLSAFLIINTITALMTQQIRQIGIMKATGGGTAQLFGMYAVLILTFGTVALLVSMPLAGRAAKAVGDGMAAWLGFFPATYHGYRSAIIQQALVALVIPLLAAAWPLYNSIRITVREALSDYGIGGNAKPKDKGISKNVLFIPRPMRLSLRNAFRRKTRLFLTLFTLILAGAIFISVYNLWASFDKVIDQIQGYFLADINISFSRGYRFDEVAGIAKSVPGVESSEGWLEYPGTLVSENKDEAGKQVFFVAPPSTSTLIQPIITSGRWLTMGDENAIVIGNALLTIFPDLKVGDTLKIKVNEKETTWHIIGTYTITGNVNPPLLYVNYEYISKLINQPGQVYSLRVITSNHDVLTQKRVSDQLLQLFEKRGIQVSNTQLAAEFIQSQTSQTDIFVYFMLLMATLIAVVGGLGLMGTMSINVLERTREVGVMRAIGASNTDIQGIVIIEGMVVGLIGWVISIALAIPITNVLCFGVGMAILTSPMPPVYGLTGILAWLIFTVFLAAIASAFPARRASKLTVRDTLAYE